MLWNVRKSRKSSCLCHSCDKQLFPSQSHSFPCFSPVIHSELWYVNNAPSDQSDSSIYPLWCIRQVKGWFIMNRKWMTESCSDPADHICLFVHFAIQFLQKYPTYFILIWNICSINHVSPNGNKCPMIRRFQPELRVWFHSCTVLWCVSALCQNYRWKKRKKRKETRGCSSVVGGVELIDTRFDRSCLSRGEFVWTLDKQHGHNELHMPLCVYACGRE